MSESRGDKITQLLIAAICVYLVVLVATVYFTRPTARRLVGALLGGAAVAVVGVGVETLAHTLGCRRSLCLRLESEP